MRRAIMDFWSETMQDDAYLVAADGWVKAAQPREIFQVKNKDKKLVWAEEYQYLKGKRRFRSDLLPASLLVARYFEAEQAAITSADDRIAAVQQQLDEMLEEHGDADTDPPGLLAEVVEGEGDKRKITEKAVKARLKEIKGDPDYDDERKALEDYAGLVKQQKEAKAARKAAQDDLYAKLHAKYPKLTETDVKQLVIDDKWLATIAAAVEGELDQVSQTLTGRVRQLAERYETPLPQLTTRVTELSAKVKKHLQRMGAVWS